MTSELYPLLAKINSLSDLKALPGSDLPLLAAELRRYIIEVVSRTGGHLASNLGVIELTIALHRVFDSPRDKIIWDVGHQTYAHKILTGRREAFSSLRQYRGVSGFPKRAESEHDIFETGHASTSISAALGLLCGQEMNGVEGKVVAVIGDGALSGGMAFEALNCAGQLGRKLIIVLNDNNMSIGQNVGALSVHLTKLTATRTYRLFRNTVDRIIRRIPLIGRRLLQDIYRLKRAFKAFFFRTDIFADLGFEYVGPLSGHDIHSLERIFKNVVVNFQRPTVIHVATVKGKGYGHAETDPCGFHGVGAFQVDNGRKERMDGLTYTEAFGRRLLDLARRDDSISAITAAMGNGTGLDPFACEFPRRFYDVGIAEQHAVTFAAGLAQAGRKPVAAIYSTFIQRAADQVIHDVALQKLPVVLALDRAGLVGQDGETHHGVFDIPLFRGVPHLEFMAPSNGEEMRLMLEYALSCGHPAILRYPRAVCSAGEEQKTAPLVAGRGEMLTARNGSLLLVALGSLVPGALTAAEALSAGHIPTDVYTLRFIRPLDEGYFLDIVAPYSHVLFLEDGVTSGGVGEALGFLLAERGLMKTMAAAGVPNRFIEQGSRQELLALCGLDVAGIVGRAHRLVGAGNLTPLSLYNPKR